jgi:hypothetical protein
MVHQQWGDDDECDMVLAPVKSVEESQEAPEPVVGIQCSNPFCDFVFPIVNKSSFESRFMSFVLDCTKRGVDPVLGCFCPTREVAKARFATVFKQLRDAQALLPKSDSNYQKYTNRILRLDQLFQLFSNKRDDCYERFRRVEQVVCDFLKDGEREWNYKEGEFSQYEKEELTNLARFMRKGKSGM